MRRLRNDNRPARHASLQLPNPVPALRQLPDPPWLAKSVFEAAFIETALRQNIRMPASDHEASGSVGAAQ